MPYDWNRSKRDFDEIRMLLRMPVDLQRIRQAQSVLRNMLEDLEQQEDFLFQQYRRYQQEGGYMAPKPPKHDV